MSDLKAQVDYAVELFLPLSEGSAVKNAENWRLTHTFLWLFRRMMDASPLTLLASEDPLGENTM